MISDYDKLKNEFDKKVLALQNRCEHKPSEWIEIWWAMGHSTGKKKKVCLNCEKIIVMRKI